jgi:hypothetical protein
MTPLAHDSQYDWGLRALGACVEVGVPVATWAPFFEMVQGLGEGPTEMRYPVEQVPGEELLDKQKLRTLLVKISNVIYVRLVSMIVVVVHVVVTVVVVTVEFCQFVYCW